jgi:hypothetical protein
MPATFRRKLARLVGGFACAAALVLLAPTAAHAAPADPISDYVPIVSNKVNEDIDENWKFSTRYMYWSVLAVKPPSGGWDVLAEVAFNGTSTFVSSEPDFTPEVSFVAIDSNMGRRPFAEYFARGMAGHAPPGWSGSLGPYTIMVAQGAKMIYAGTTTVSWPNGSFVVVRDIYLNTGQQAVVTVNPFDAAYIFGSDPANSATWVLPRASAGARSTFGYMGYTAPRPGYYGLVLVNRRGVASSTVRITVT